eukprot:3600612-Prymnesium_polylepis.2
MFVCSSASSRTPPGLGRSHSHIARAPPQLMCHHSPASGARPQQATCPTVGQGGGDSQASRRLHCSIPRGPHAHFAADASTSFQVKHWCAGHWLRLHRLAGGARTWTLDSTRLN